MKCDAPKPVIACDLGGTRIKLGLVDGLTILGRSAIDAQSREGLAPQLPRLEAAIASLCQQQHLSPDDCAGLVLAFPSLVDARSGKVLAEFHKYADAMDLNLPAWCREHLNLPLVMENDARAAAIGEWQAGAGRGCDDMVMVTLGTGIGTCAIIDGRVIRGKHAQATIMGGHLSVAGTPRPCSCGALGCAEAQGSTAYLPAIVEAVCGPRAVTKLPDFRAVFTLADGGDGDALHVRRHVLGVWGAHAVNLIHAFDPEKMIYGGGILASRDVIVPALQQYVDRHACTPWGKVEIVSSQLGDDAALLAAPFLIQERF